MIILRHSLNLIQEQRTKEHSQCTLRNAMKIKIKLLFDYYTINSTSYTQWLHI